MRHVMPKKRGHAFEEVVSDFVARRFAILFDFVDDVVHGLRSLAAMVREKNRVEGMSVVRRLTERRARNRLST